MAWQDIVTAGWEEGQRLAMVGPGDVRVHLEHGQMLAAALEPPARALDLGAGAGVPGLVLAGTWPDSRWVFVDAALRRVRLLRAIVERAGWQERVEVRHERAEELGRDLGYRGAFDLVTARLFGPPAVAAECGAPFLGLGGVLAVTEPPGSRGERWPADGVALLGLEKLPFLHGVQRLRRVGPLEDRFPRRAGVPARRPLF